VHKYAILAWSVAIGCWLAAGILTQLLRGPLALGSDSTTFTPYLDANEQLALHTNVTSSLASTSLAVLFYGVLSGMWVVLVVFVANGANWARITQTVLGVIGGIAVLWQALSSLRGSGSGAVLPGCLDIGALLAIAVATLVMYLPATNAYFAGRSPDAPRPTRPFRPVVVTRAVWLCVAGVGLGIVATIVHTWQLPSQPGTVMLAGVAVAGHSPTGTIGSVVDEAFRLAVQVAMIVFLARGANWARILETIIIAGGVVMLPISLLLNFTRTPSVVVTWSLSLVAVIFEVVVIVLLYRPAANEFFRTAPPSVARAVP
jgi:hypothetical protein